MGSNRGKSNIAIAILEKISVYHHQILFSNLSDFRYEEDLMNIWLVLIKNYPEAVVLGKHIDK